MRLYIVGPRGGGDGAYHLIEETTGRVIAIHICSYASYAYDHLSKDRQWQQDVWETEYGEFEVVRPSDYVGPRYSAGTLTYDELLALNRAGEEQG